MDEATDVLHHRPGSIRIRMAVAADAAVQPADEPPDRSHQGALNVTVID